MNKRIISIDMVFDYRKFANDIAVFRDAHGLQWHEIDELAGIGKGNCIRIAKGSKNMKMDTWLSIANAMDIDVRTYFVLSDWQDIPY